MHVFLQCMLLFLLKLCFKSFFQTSCGLILKLGFFQAATSVHLECRVSIICEKEIEQGLATKINQIFKSNMD